MCPKRVYTDGVRCAVWRAGRGGILDMMARLNRIPRTPLGRSCKLHRATRRIPFRIEFRTVVVSSEMREHAGPRLAPSPATRWRFEPLGTNHYTDF